MSNLAILANSKTQNGFLFPVHAMFRHDCPPSGETCKYATAPSTKKKKKKTWRDSLSIDVLLSAVSVSVVAQSSFEFPDGLVNYPVHLRIRVAVLLARSDFIDTGYENELDCSVFFGVTP
jgi:hypothetical protein